VFKKPLSLFIGVVTAVGMELTEPRVRTGVWERTTRRTAVAGPLEVAEQLTHALAQISTLPGTPALCREDLQRDCGGSVGTIDGSVAGSLAFDGKPRTQPEWRL
jgi:hypothetical protein